MGACRINRDDGTLDRQRSQQRRTLNAVFSGKIADQSISYTAFVVVPVALNTLLNTTEYNILYNKGILQFLKCQ